MSSEFRSVDGSMRILHLIDAFDQYGSARQLALLAPGLQRAGCSIEVCCIGRSCECLETLRHTGIAVHTLGWTRWFDAPALWQLRQLVCGGRFDLIHVWRLAALRALGLVASGVLPRVVISAALPHNRQLNVLDRHLLRRVRCVALTSDHDRERCMHEGLQDIRWQIVPAAAVPPRGAGILPAAIARYSRRIACTGRLERGQGFREAIWAADVLRQVDPDLHLLIAGAGPRQADLQTMIERLDIANAHLLGESVEATDVLASAAICWVPSKANRGDQAAIEAMALGRAVIASDVPCLRSLIIDGVTGHLVPPGDPVALARKTWALLHDPAQCERLGQAARIDIRARFALERVASRWHRLYHELVGRPSAMAA
jgi:glycosyltransferase involved in cell wall biosynthesis